MAALLLQHKALSITNNMTAKAASKQMQEGLPMVLFQNRMPTS
jgi:hypothetical protein